MHLSFFRIIGLIFCLIVPDVFLYFIFHIIIFSPRLLFVVVQKRGSTRFFYKGPNEFFQNAPMGTVVDNTITGRKISNFENPNAPDFYLVSQSVRQGTVSPSHYRVLANDFKNIDWLQQLTFMLSHMYYNWPVSYKCVILNFQVLNSN